MKAVRSWVPCIAGLTLTLFGSGLASSAVAAGFEVLTAGKVAKFANRGDPAKNGASIAIGGDRALQTLYNPTCPATSAVEIEAYLQSTLPRRHSRPRRSRLRQVVRPRGRLPVHRQTGTVRSIRYAAQWAEIEIRGAGLHTDRRSGRLRAGAVADRRSDAAHPRAQLQAERWQEGDQPQSRQPPRPPAKPASGTHCLAMPAPKRTSSR